MIISAGTYTVETIETLPWCASGIFAGLERDRFNIILFLRVRVRLYNYYNERINMLCINVSVPNIRPILRLEVVISHREDDCPYTYGIFTWPTYQVQNLYLH